MEILKRFRNKFINPGVEIQELSDDKVQSALRLVETNSPPIQRVQIGDLIRMGIGNGYSGEHVSLPKYEPIWKGTILIFLGTKGIMHFFLHKGRVVWTRGRTQYSKISG